MRHRVVMESLNRIERRPRCGLEVAPCQRHLPQAEMRMRVVGIDLQRLGIGPLRIVELIELCI